jgi:large-conductance mechanosensitive channel
MTSQGEVTFGRSFAQVFSDLDVFGTTLGVLIGGQVAQTTEALIQNLLLPTIDPILSKINTDTRVSVGPVTIKIQPILQSVIKLVIIALLVTLMMAFGLQVRKPVTWVSVRSVGPNVKL